MPKPEKVEKIKEIAEKLAKAKGIYFTDYLGMTVEEMGQLRSEFYKQNVDYQVVKNTLCRISVKKVGLDIDEKFLTGPTALALAYDNPVIPARIIRDYLKKNKKEKPIIKGLVFEGKALPGTEAEAIAALPTRQELLARFLATLNAPVTNFARVLAASLQKLLGTLTALKEKKSN